MYHDELRLGVSGELDRRDFGLWEHTESLGGSICYDFELVFKLG